MRRALIIALLVLAAVPLLFGVSQLPPIGSTGNPTYTHVVPRYLEEGAEEAGAENIVTAVILNYRGYDTNGEVTVIFTALVAVLGVLTFAKATAAKSEPAEETPVPAPPMPVSPVTRFIVRILAPFILLFSIYMVIYGHTSPGGGFQGGTIVGALLIAVSLVSGSAQAKRLLPERIRPWLQPAAVLAFALVGVAGLWLIGPYLSFPVEGELVFLRTPWLTIIEFGIGIGGAAIVASIFWAMEGSD